MLAGTFAGVGLLVLGVGVLLNYIISSEADDPAIPVASAREEAPAEDSAPARAEPPRVRIRDEVRRTEAVAEVVGFAETVARMELWPAEVTLIARQQMPLFQGDQMVGERVIAAGTTLELREIGSDGVLVVRDRGRRLLVAVEDTDLQQRVQGDLAAEQIPWVAVERPGSLWQQAERSLIRRADQTFNQAYRQWALDNNWVLEIDFEPGRIIAVADPRAAGNGDRERLRKLAGYLAQSYLVKGEEAGRSETFVECHLLDPESGEPIMRMTYALGSGR